MRARGRVAGSSPSPPPSSSCTRREGRGSRVPSDESSAQERITTPRSRWREESSTVTNMAAASSPAPAFGQKSSRAMLKEEIQRHHLSAWRLHMKNVKTRRVRLQSMRTRIFIRAWRRALHRWSRYAAARGAARRPRTSPRRCHPRRWHPAASPRSSARGARASRPRLRRPGGWSAPRTGSARSWPDPRDARQHLERTRRVQETRRARGGAAHARAARRRRAGGTRRARARRRAEKARRVHSWRGARRMGGFVAIDG